MRDVAPLVAIDGIKGGAWHGRVRVHREDAPLAGPSLRVVRWRFGYGPSGVVELDARGLRALGIDAGHVGARQAADRVRRVLLAYTGQRVEWVGFAGG